VIKRPEKKKRYFKQIPTRNTILAVERKELEFLKFIPSFFRIHNSRIKG
jgi:hypothetical protein